MTACEALGSLWARCAQVNLRRQQRAAALGLAARRSGSEAKRMRVITQHTDSAAAGIPQKAGVWKSRRPPVVMPFSNFRLRVPASATALVEPDFGFQALSRGRAHTWPIAVVAAAQ